MSSLLSVKAMQITPAIEQVLLAVAQHQAGTRRLAQPIGIIGPSDGGPLECAAAFDIAFHLSKAGITLVCGGRGGVMEAASRGASEAGGCMIGLLPDNDISQANAYLTVALPTGMGEMRNALIARSCFGLIAIGGGLGTISEMALGLKLGKPVFAIYEDVALDGLRTFTDPDALMLALLPWLQSKMECLC
jgi:uncharacterized protein (TIGR00725 family)